MPTCVPPLGPFRPLERSPGEHLPTTISLPCLRCGLMEHGIARLRKAVLRPAWAPGQSGNPKGRPAGSKNRKPPRTMRGHFLWLMRRYRRAGASPATAEVRALAELAVSVLPVVRSRSGARGGRWPDCRWCGRALGIDAVPVMLEPDRWAHSGCLPTLALALMNAARAEVLRRMGGKLPRLR